MLLASKRSFTGVKKTFLVFSEEVYLMIEPETVMMFEWSWLDVFKCFMKVELACVFTWTYVVV